MQRRIHRQRCPSTHTRRGAALYTAVLAVSMLVAVLGLTALKVFDVERRGSTASLDAAAARRNARAAVEFALQDVWTDPDWRTHYAHNAETTSMTFGPGTLTWRLKDTTDSNLADDLSDPVEVIGIGRVGTSAWVTSVIVQPIEREVGPIELRAYTDTSSLSSDVVTNAKSWAQYFRPYLPTSASSWRVTGLDIYAQRDGVTAGATAVGLYLPQASGKPGSTLIDQATVSESAITSGMAYNHVDFTANASLNPATGLCITFTTTSGTPIRLAMDAGGVDATNTKLVDGYPGWLNTYSTSSLLYRVTGTYRVRELQVLSGSWKRSPLP